MLEQQQLMTLFAGLSDAISARDGASTRIKGIEQQKPRNVDNSTYIAYKELEAASAWQERLDAATAEMTIREEELKAAQDQVLAALPETVRERLKKNVPIIIGEGDRFLGLYQRGKELAILTGQQEYSLYSQIHDFYSRGGTQRGGVQDMLNNLYR